MSSKTIIVLVIVLALLVGIVAIQKKKQAQSEVTEIATGDVVIPDMDVNAVAEIKIQSGDDVVTLKRGDDGWIVPDRYGYRADFNKLADVVTKIADLKVGQVVQGAEFMLDEYGLDADADVKPTTVTLLDSSGNEEAVIVLGEERTSSTGDQMGMGWSPPAGRYIQIDKDGPVVVVDEVFYGMEADADAWLSKALVAVPKADVTDVTVKQDGESYTLTSIAPNQFELEGLQPGKKTKKPTVDQVAGALQNVQAISVADPDAENLEDNFAEVVEYTAQAKDGVVYTMLIGKKSEDNKGKYVRLKFDFTEPEAPSRDDIAASVPKEENGEALSDEAYNQRVESTHLAAVENYEKQVAETQEKVAKLKKDFEPWTYVIATYNADNMTTPRDQLIETAEEQIGQAMDDAAIMKGMPPSASKATVTIPAEPEMPESIDILEPESAEEDSQSDNKDRKEGAK